MLYFLIVMIFLSLFLINPLLLLLDEPYAIYSPPDMAEGRGNHFGPAIVPPDSFFMLGDNRNYSFDSRFFGFVERSQVIGKLDSIYWSWDENTRRIRWERIGSSIDSIVESSSQGREGEKQNQWPYREFEYVKAYLYNLDNQLHAHHALVKNSQLDKTVVGKGILLTQKQVDIIIETTNQDIAGLIQGLSKSYIPHHGFVFYNKAHQPAAYITLCFDCEAIRVYPEIKSPGKFEELSEKEIKRLLHLLDRYRQIINESKLPIFDTPFQYQEYGKGLR
ncbi:MAG: signal peptidase I [Candidatus Aminicenantes bacterium]|nr:signal peptidase I [Candidatus Aminicenantes bacterium]NIM82807.1 signal peptidase I [Candidatus Aminicenantes bacterium]NIN22191.1 signal peptidase I [Candidatus Aminicenantes bacterium]NIN45951.1 signal peptidase I [Candidatus Aminicenantes bacterium]NIN88787.1 signal peptidase I [Candidatus Aminicenantes bacterium]